MHRGLKPHLFKGAYAALKGRSFTAVYTFVCFSAACKADVKNEPAIAALKRCDTQNPDKKRNRAVGPGFRSVG
jgi:hypothetical protein